MPLCIYNHTNMQLFTCSGIIVLIYLNLGLKYCIKAEDAKEKFISRVMPTEHSYFSHLSLVHSIHHN